jgi:N-acetylglucosaminyldiphosphoundecaprenol N-acetyl-beta-D-mannosaminyltransferase
MMTDKSPHVPSRTVIMGLPVHPVSEAQALQWVSDQVAFGSAPSWILAANPEKVYHLKASAFLQSFFERAGLCVPDGIGIVLALRLLRRQVTRRLAGADLMQAICEQSARLGHRIFLFGSDEAVSIQACKILQSRHPQIQIVGRANGFDPNPAGLVGRINASGANILFVALGSPRQEQWVSDNFAKLDTVKVIQCIGGTLDTIAGRVPRAPQLFRNLGLEWFFRLLRQPTRLPRQMVLIRFAAQVLIRSLRGADPAAPPD